MAPHTGRNPGDYIHIQPSGRWLIDSGASNHYTSIKHIISDFKEIPDVNIMMGKGCVSAKGIGNVTLHTNVGLRTVFDMMWVPELTGRHNLLNIPQLISKHCDIRMNINGTTIHNKEGVLLMEGVFTGKGFLVKMSVCSTTMQIAQLMPMNNKLVPIRVIIPGQIATYRSKDITSIQDDFLAMLAGSEDTQPIEVWHTRLGHLNQAAIQQLTTRAIGLHIGPARPQTISMKYDLCLREAQYKQISYIRSDKPIRILEHIWADLKGALLEQDVYSFKFFIAFVEEKTRYTNIYPLLEKGDAFGAFKIYEARAERVTGYKIVNLHVDGGGEFVSNNFRAHCRDRGIAIHFTQPYSTEMDSISERMMRTIIEHVSAMLWMAGLPVGFWAAAVKTSVFLTHRSPATALQGMTPYEAYFGRKPNLGFLKVWGCGAAAYVPDELRTQTDWTSKSTNNCIFIGYSETENLYELWDVQKADLIRKRDVIFWEHEMGHPSLTHYALPHGVSIYGGITGKIVLHL